MTERPSGRPAEFQGGSNNKTARGQRFVLQNRWEVVDHLGQGGMGTVYMARDLRLANRQCVVKKLRDDFFREEDKEKALAFFHREAEVLAKLEHPNIVDIRDSFHENGEYYLVMDYVEGENLHQMLYKRGEPFPEEQVLQWASQIAEVLHYMHTHDPPVIYRDLKPSNIMIDTKDRVKLVDFGIARPYMEDSDNTHVVSAGYSPPEQYWGAADPRSDIYALGATMYFLLTGQEPLALQVSSPKKLNASISDHTDYIVQRATAQDVWLRFQSAPEMREELDVRPEPPKVKNRAKMMDVAIALVILLSTVGLAFLAMRLVEVHNDSDPDKTQRIKMSELEQEKTRAEQRMKEEQSKRLQAEERELKLLREYSAKEKAPAEPNFTIQITTLPASNKSKEPDMIFQEDSEGQLTDPEGLAPMKELDDGDKTTSNSSFNIPFLTTDKPE